MTNKSLDAIAKLMSSKHESKEDIFRNRGKLILNSRTSLRIHSKAKSSIMARVNPESSIIKEYVEEEVQTSPRVQLPAKPPLSIPLPPLPEPKAVQKEVVEQPSQMEQFLVGLIHSSKGSRESNTRCFGSESGSSMLEDTN